MRGVEDIKEILHIPFPFLAVVQQQQRNGKEGIAGNMYAHPCVHHGDHRDRHAQNAQGQNVQFFDCVGGRYAMKVKNRCKYGQYATVEFVIDGKVLTEDIRPRNQSGKQQPSRKRFPQGAFFFKRAFFRKLHRVNHQG